MAPGSARLPLRVGLVPHPERKTNNQIQKQDLQQA